MINYSNPVLLKLRTFGQRLGVLRPVVRLYRKLFNLSYESKFDQIMLNKILPDDVVWDVGANVGFFTKKFAEKVGRDGYVFAFEPSINTYHTLVKNCASFENTKILNMGLSNVSGNLHFRESDIENDPTNGIVDAGTPGAIVVVIATGDELVKSNSVKLPNVIKIDVEGFELDVIQGMTNILKNSALKKLLIEVHFLEMAKRGLKNGSTEIVKIINNSGFKVSWIDPSHLIAER